MLQEPALRTHDGSFRVTGVSWTMGRTGSLARYHGTIASFFTCHSQRNSTGIAIKYYPNKPPQSLSALRNRLYIFCTGKFTGPQRRDALYPFDEEHLAR